MKKAKQLSMGDPNRLEAVKQVLRVAMTGLAAAKDFA